MNNDQKQTILQTKLKILNLFLHKTLLNIVYKSYDEVVLVESEKRETKIRRKKKMPLYTQIYSKEEPRRSS